ncbi:MAG: hypothetical protein ACOY3P_25030, partial [Planctomycetota bacterium]
RFDLGLALLAADFDLNTGVGSITEHEHRNCPSRPFRELFHGSIILSITAVKIFSVEPRRRNGV